jgi:phosphatidylglycerol:prolipoprotein diacylglycerol transferase
MHPVMFTISGWMFKILVPLLILWGCYSIVINVNRASPPPPSKKKTKTDDEVVKSDAKESGFKLPADTPFNAIVSILIGLGVFAFAAPVTLTGSNFEKFVQTLKAFANGPIWRQQWEKLPIYSYGVMLGLSLVAGWYIVLGLMDRQYKETDPAKRAEYRSKMADCYVFTAFFAVAGSRVLYILTNLSEFPTIESMLRLRSGGLVAYGGFLGGLLGSIIYLKRNGFSLWPWADAAVPSLGTGLAITRMGCYMYGCDFGSPLPPNAPGFLKTLGTFPHWADNHGAPAWQQHVTMGFHTSRATCEGPYHGVWSAADNLCRIPAAAQHSVPVHPTQLYESLLGFTIFLALMWLWKRRKFEGQIFLAFGILYGVGRSLLEVIRDDAERGAIGPLSTSQAIGIVTAILAAGFYYYRLKNAPPADGVDFFKKFTPPTPPEPPSPPEAAAA